jgi:hypothetical protein
MMTYFSFNGLICCSFHLANTRQYDYLYYEVYVYNHSDLHAAFTQSILILCMRSYLVVALLFHSIVGALAPFRIFSTSFNKYYLLCSLKKGSIILQIYNNKIWQKNSRIIPRWVKKKVPPY